MVSSPLDYNADVQSASTNSAPILSLFLTLGVLQIGHAYSLSQSFPGPAQQRVLEDLEHYGFIYRGSNGGDYFYPTHLATSLCSGDLAGQMGGVEGEEKRFLILETNYKIYAYTGMSCSSLWDPPRVSGPAKVIEAATPEDGPGFDRSGLDLLEQGLNGGVKMYTKTRAAAVRTMPE